MAGPRTEVHLRQLEELIRRCDLVALAAAIERRDIPSEEEHELYLSALDAGGEISADDILDQGVFGGHRCQRGPSPPRCRGQPLTLGRAVTDGAGASLNS